MKLNGINDVSARFQASIPYQNHVAMKPEESITPQTFPKSFNTLSKSRSNETAKSLDHAMLWQRFNTLSKLRSNDSV
ncbi:hypothetical protein, partial [Vibrio rarus]|uniref:hypothetical protein n=1 Tax=Vibrio rarus TaxID=413403 RepID=UPI0039ED3995